MTPARIAQKLRLMAKRYPGPGYSLAHPDLHNSVFHRLGHTDDWSSDDDAQWITFLLIVAEDVAGVRACGSNGTADCQSTPAEQRCAACPHGVQGTQPADYQGVRCACIVTGCKAGPGCPHYGEHCRKHIAHARGVIASSRGQR